jgi:hypothetical protein
MRIVLMPIGQISIDQSTRSQMTIGQLTHNIWIL